jgi:two-component system cell cycle sensor histidine kinase/response regulator CckA
MDSTRSRIAPHDFKRNGRAARSNGAEASRLRAGRLECFAALAGGASHEMSNLLATVLMSVEVLRGGCRTPAAREVLAGLAQLTRRGLEVTRQLQWLAGGVNSAPALFQPRFLLADLRALVSATFPRSVAVTTSYPQDLWMLEGDPLLLYQSLLDLLLAARDSLPGGGMVELAARNERLELGDGGAGGGAVPHVVFEVSARPQPAAAARAPRRNGGDAAETETKLGGAPAPPRPSSERRCGWAALRAGGGLRQPSLSHAGCDGGLCLPAAESEEDREERVAQPPRGAGELVLIADEEGALGDMLAAVLEQFGYRALTVRQVAACDERLPEVAVVLTSPEAEARARALVPGRRRAPPAVVLLVGSLEVESGSGSRAVMLRKPFTTGQLLASVARALSEAAGGRKGGGGGGGRRYSLSPRRTT